MKYDVLVSNTLELSVFLKHRREVDILRGFSVDSPCDKSCEMGWRCCITIVRMCSKAC